MSWDVIHRISLCGCENEESNSQEYFELLFTAGTTINQTFAMCQALCGFSICICKYNYIYIFVCVCAQSCLTPQTPWTVGHQTPLPTGFFWQDYWSGLPFPPPGIFPTQGLNLHLLHFIRQITTEPPGNPLTKIQDIMACLLNITSFSFHLSESESVSRSVVSNSLGPRCQFLLPMGFSRQEYWIG